MVCGNSCTISSCRNEGNVTGPLDVGGIFGYSSDSQSSISNNLVTNCIITGTSGTYNYGAGVIATTYYGKFANNFYTTDAVLKVGNQTYDGQTPRGVWGGYDTTTGSYVPIDITENCAAMLLINGDVNGDREVDIADAVCIVNYLMGNAPAGFNAVAADVNGDGMVDITDAETSVNIIINEYNK